jgi:hypothetical protein
MRHGCPLFCFFTMPSSWCRENRRDCGAGLVIPVQVLYFIQFNTLRGHLAANKNKKSAAVRESPSVFVVLSEGESNRALVGLRPDDLRLPSFGI